MKQLKKAVHLLQMASGLVLFGCLPLFFNTLTRWTLYVFVATSVADYLLNKRYQDNPIFTWAKAPFWACVALFACLLGYIPLEQNTQHLSLLMESRTAFLAFGIMGIMGTKAPKPKYLAYTCVAVCVALILYVLYLGGVNHVFEHEDWRNSLIQLRHTRIHAHMAFNTFLNVGIAACFWLLKRSGKSLKSILWGLLIGLFYVCVGLSDGRLGFIASNVVLLMGIVYMLHTHYKKWMITGLLLMGLIGGAALLSHPKINTSDKLEENIRYHIWKECWHLYTQHPFVGVGTSTNAQRIADTFIASEEISKERFLIGSLKQTDMTGAHPHNQLLQSAMEYGIMGWIGMLLILVVPLAYMAKNNCDIMLTSIWIVILLQLQTEVIRGSLGDMQFCFYLFLTMNYAQQSAKKVKSRMQGHGQLPSTAG